MLKISAVYLIGKAEIPIHYTTWGQVEQALLRVNRIVAHVQVYSLRSHFANGIHVGIITSSRGPLFCY